jgi:hypothetical protein
LTAESPSIAALLQTAPSQKTAPVNPPAPANGKSAIGFHRCEGWRDCVTPPARRISVDTKANQARLVATLKADMSKGLGRIERAILNRIREQRRRKERVLVDGLDVALDVYESGRWVNGIVPRAQRVPILRAMHSVVRKYPENKLIGGKGTTPLRIVSKRAARRARSPPL